MALTIYKCILILLHRIKSERLEETLGHRPQRWRSLTEHTHIENKSIEYAEYYIEPSRIVQLLGLMSSILFFFLCQNQDLQITSSTQK